VADTGASAVSAGGCWQALHATRNKEIADHRILWLIVDGPQSVKAELPGMLSSEVCSHAQIVVASTWDGQPIERERHTVVEYSVVRSAVGTQVRLTWDAPHDGLTQGPQVDEGFFPELWRFEVVEVFIAGANGAYLEFEVGPWGHFAVFAFASRRQKERNVPVQHYTAERVAGRFRGSLSFDASALPPGALRWNAHRIDGPSEARRYFSARANPGARPDFHNLAAAVPLIPV
jgi:hypothetical protein